MGYASMLAGAYDKEQVVPLVVVVDDVVVEEALFGLPLVRDHSALEHLLVDAADEAAVEAATRNRLCCMAWHGSGDCLAVFV